MCGAVPPLSHTPSGENTDSCAFHICGINSRTADVLLQEEHGTVHVQLKHSGKYISHLTEHEVSLLHAACLCAPCHIIIPLHRLT